MADSNRAAPVPAKILTDADFFESAGNLVPRQPEPGVCLLVVVHSGLHGTPLAEDESDPFEARQFLQTVLAAAQEFPEVQVGLLNYRLAKAITARLPIDDPGPSSYAQALIFSGGTEWHQIVCGVDETAETIRLWLRGVLLAYGFRPTSNQDDLTVRLACELAQPERISFSEARWGVPKFRSEVHKAAKRSVVELIDKWVHRGV